MVVAPRASLEPMTTSTIVLSVLLATAAATAVSFGLRPSTEPLPGPDPVAALQHEVAALQKTQAELQQQLAALASAPASVPAPRAIERIEAPTVTTEQVAAAVEAYLGKRSGGGASAAAAPAPGFDLDKDFALLVGTDLQDNATAWRKAFAAGAMDEVIEKFEAEAKANPNDAKKQMDLANACIAYLQLDSTKAPVMGAKADQSWDRVLELEPTHWDARFSKAVSYTFWPEFTGKPKEAIKHFETLVEQQESMPVDEGQAQTYLMLGNLLEQRDLTKAKAVWAKGAKRHPNNADLAKKAAGR